MTEKVTQQDIAEKREELDEVLSIRIELESQIAKIEDKLKRSV